MQKFTDLLEGEGVQVKRVGIETKAYVAMTVNGEGGEDVEGGDNQQPSGGGDIEG
jgi:hypothetical protein